MLKYSASAKKHVPYLPLVSQTRLKTSPRLKCKSAQGIWYKPFIRQHAAISPEVRGALGTYYNSMDKMLLSSNCLCLASHRVQMLPRHPTLGNFTCFLPIYKVRVEPEQSMWANTNGKHGLIHHPFTAFHSRSTQNVSVGRNSLLFKNRLGLCLNAENAIF